jgi:hypothetical protein
MCYTPGRLGYYPGYYHVSCTSCAATSHKYEDEKWESGKGTYKITEQAIESATAWWNRRPGESAAPAQVPLTDSAIDALWYPNHIDFGHAVQKACAEQWGVKLEWGWATPAVHTDSKLLKDSTLMHIILNGTQYEALVFPAGYFKKETKE